ncbi:hypothetical protein WI91_08015 [Burkholderia vietnamiensis]|uniref:hypothetical protein n=1 Tax=Burkholderia vietnamiensis TaxID=60552 RepID=UPI0007579E58|nr:hypothetical protein [Burkholderia vietnamiensis]KVE06283.1 hypothetical protein WI91_08015 [Burkholderia vietnamiensis]
MYRNHHAIRLADLEREEKRLRQEMSSAQARLGHFEEFDGERAYSALSQLKRDTHATREKLSEIEKAIQSNAEQLADARKTAEPGFLGRFYMSTEQSVATRQIPTLEARADQLRTDRSTLMTDLAQKETSEQSLAADLERYRRVDPLETRALLAQLGAELQQTQAGMDHARKASERWEAAAGELVREYDRVKHQIRTNESDIIIAGTLQRSLAAAQTARDRARIHQDCEARFGLGNRSPGNVLKKANSKHHKLQRDAEKLERRLEDIVRVLDKQITKLVLDGNNLCYATTRNGHDRFVGIEPLKALVSRLRETYTVELLFDPSITGRTQMKGSELRASFPNVRVDIMRRDPADPAVLAAAEFDEHAYVISNDGYAEFPDKDPVKNKRIIKHIIHPRSIQIPALDLNIPYQQEQVS